jgi:hypothetical protein
MRYCEDVTKILNWMAPIREPDQVVREGRVFGLSFARTQEMPSLVLKRNDLVQCLKRIDRYIL